MENNLNVKTMNPADSKIPEGPIAEKWTNYKAHQKLVNPANKRRLDIIVVGTGLAGASAASSLAEMGFNAGVLGILGMGVTMCIAYYLALTYFFSGDPAFIDQKIHKRP